VHDVKCAKKRGRILAEQITAIEGDISGEAGGGRELSGGNIKSGELAGRWKVSGYVNEPQSSIRNGISNME
jgi:hypothetical protein